MPCPRGYAISINRNDSPDPSQSGPAPADGRRRLAERQVLERQTIDDSFERKRRELGLDGVEPAAPAETPGSGPPPRHDSPREDPPRHAPPRDDPSRPFGPILPELDRRIVLAFVLVIVVSLGLGLLAGTCWSGTPEPPLEALGLGTPPGSGDSPGVGAETADAPADTPAEGDDLDPEQQAFAERRERELAERQEEPEPGSAVPDFTDHALVQELAGSWRLDLGRGRRGYRVRFGSDPVRTVHRQRFDVTLFDVVGSGVAGSGLPPYFTVLDLPDGKLLAFLDAAGTFRLVLEDVRRESDGRLSWSGPLRQRRYGTRLDGDSAWRFGRDRDARAAASPEPEASSQPGAEPEVEPDAEADAEAGRAPAGVGFRAQPVPPTAEAVARLHDGLERHLDELAFGLMERDTSRIYALWGGRPDAVTRAAIDELLQRYGAMRVWTRLLALDVGSTADGPEARFEVVVTIQGAPKGARNRRDVDLRDVRWRGRLGLRAGADSDPVQLDPFPG